MFAAPLDGIDGRVARLLKGQSKFGAELDSLADFVNFGVVPGLILYFWGLNELGAIGWIAALVFAICMSLRLARFNVMVDDPNRPVWAANFFTGVPAPAGAIIVLLPIYLRCSACRGFPVWPVLTLAIAFLLVSTLPVFSGKKLGTRVPRDMVLPVFVAVVLFVALLVSYPWYVLTIAACFISPHCRSAGFPIAGLHRRMQRRQRRTSRRRMRWSGGMAGSAGAPWASQVEVRAAGTAELSGRPRCRAHRTVPAGEAGRPIRDTLLLIMRSAKSGRGDFRPARPSLSN